MPREKDQRDLGQLLDRTMNVSLLIFDGRTGQMEFEAHSRVNQRNHFGNSDQ